VGRDEVPMKYANAAALLTLRKKARAIWGNEDE
jgi:hypothetical protein